MTMINIAKHSYAAVLLSMLGLALISPQALARVEETNPSVSYTVGWTQGDTSGTWSGGTAAVSTAPGAQAARSEEHTSELQSPCNLVCRLLLEKKNSHCYISRPGDFARSSQTRRLWLL